MRYVARRLLILAAVLSFSVSVARSAELDRLLELFHLVEQNEPKQKWKKINWAADLPAAFKDAQKRNKPILVFMLVNEGGKKDAEHC